MKAVFSQYHCTRCSRMNMQVAYPAPFETYCVDCGNETTHRRR